MSPSGPDLMVKDDASSFCRAVKRKKLGGKANFLPAATAWGYAWPVGAQPLRMRWMLQLQMPAVPGG